jgi:hypothetical protein
VPSVIGGSDAEQVAGVGIPMTPPPLKLKDYTVIARFYTKALSPEDALFRANTEMFNCSSSWMLEDVQICCTSHRPYQSERDKVLDGKTTYRCKSDTCEDNGGCCILVIPCGYESPTSCVNPESFENNGDTPDCIWEELRQQAGEQL